MKIYQILKIILIIEIIWVLCTAVSLARGYQDSWILEGLEIPFAVFIGTFLAYFFISKDEKIVWIVVISVIVRMVILLIPIVKYSWFYGTEVDQWQVFGWFKYVNSIGFIPSFSAQPAMFYVPMSSIWMSIISHLTGLPELITIKYFPLFFWLPYPAFIYMIMKKLSSSNRTIKYAVLISAIPIDISISYMVSGSLFGCLLLVLAIYCFIVLLKSKKINYFTVSVLSATALVMFHSYSSIMLILGLVVLYILWKSNFVKNKSTYLLYKMHLISKSTCDIFRKTNFNLRVKSRFVFFIAFLIIFEVCYAVFLAPNLFDQASKILVQWINGILGHQLAGAPTTNLSQAPSLIRLSFTNIARIIIVYFGATLFLIILTFLGIIRILKKPILSKYLLLLAVFLAAIWGFYFVQLILTRGNSGLMEYTRLFRYTLILSPVFIGVLLSYFKSKKIIVSIVCIIVLLGTIQLYAYQPLLPIASTVRPNLPSNEYIIYVGRVNSMYQVYMINFAQKHISTGQIACDVTTQEQLLGLTNYTFYNSHVMEYYPFSTTNMTEKDFDYLMIHLPGESGTLGEAPEVQSAAFVNTVTSNSDILYSNGQSFILGKPFFFNEIYNQTQVK